MLIHHGSVTLVGARGDSLRLGSAEFRGLLLDLLLYGGSWRESSAANVFGGLGSLLDGDCWTVVACVAVTRTRSTCGTSS